jgi:hypothetical protein
MPVSRQNSSGHRRIYAVGHECALGFPISK